MATKILTMCGVGAIFLSSLNSVAAEPVAGRGGLTHNPTEAAVIDEALHTKVKDGWYNISIVAYPEEVILRGEVENEQTRNSIVSTSRSVSNKPVRDALTVKPPRSDSQVAQDIRQTLQKEYPSLFNSVDVSVNQGVAQLQGNLKSHREVDQVLAAVVMQSGVKDIESDIKVKGRPYPVQQTRARSKTGKY